MTYDNSLSAQTTTSFSYTTGGTQRVLVVCDFTNTSTAPTHTFNGVSVPFSHTYATAISTWLHVFVLMNPDLGAYTLTRTGGSGVTTNVWSGKDCKQTGQPKTNASNGGAPSKPMTATLTVATLNSWVVAFYAGDRGIPTSADSPMTLRSGGSTNLCTYDSNSGLATGSFTATLQDSVGTPNWGMTIIEIETSSTETNGNPALMGLIP